MDTIRSDLAKAEETLIQIEREERRCCPCCPVLPWSMSKSKYKSRKSVIWFPKPQEQQSSQEPADPLASIAFWREASTETDPISRKTHSLPSTDPKTSVSPVHRASYQPVGPAGRKSKEFVEKEIGDNMEEISSIVKNLNQLARGMEGEIVQSNAQLDRLNTKAESNVRRISAATKHAKNVYEMDSNTASPSSSSSTSWFHCRSCFFSNKFAAAGAITKL